MRGLTRFGLGAATLALAQRVGAQESTLDVSGTSVTEIAAPDALAYDSGASASVRLDYAGTCASPPCTLYIRGRGFDGKPVSDLQWSLGAGGPWTTLSEYDLPVGGGMSGGSYSGRVFLRIRVTYEGYPSLGGAQAYRPPVTLTLRQS